MDIYFKICEQPRMFEWNYMHHWALEYVCMDIDGVLCEDPSVYQNDDGKNYYDFLINAIPKIIPTQKVGKLVSCRLEKYSCLLYTSIFMAYPWIILYMVIPKERKRKYRIKGRQ